MPRWIKINKAHAVKDEENRSAHYFFTMRRACFFANLSLVIIMTLLSLLIKRAYEKQALIQRARTGEVEIFGELMKWVSEQLAETRFDSITILILTLNGLLFVLIILIFKTVKSYKLYKMPWRGVKYFPVAICVVESVFFILYVRNNGTGVLLWILYFVGAIVPKFFYAKLFFPLESRPGELQKRIWDCFDALANHIIDKL